MCRADISVGQLWSVAVVKRSYFLVSRAPATLIVLVLCCCLLQVTEEDLAKYFGLLGEVNNVIMLRDKFTNRHKVR